jgi:hypothetical protein
MAGMLQPKGKGKAAPRDLGKLLSSTLRRHRTRNDLGLTEREEGYIQLEEVLAAAQLWDVTPEACRKLVSSRARNVTAIGTHAAILYWNRSTGAALPAEGLLHVIKPK